MIIIIMDFIIDNWIDPYIEIILFQSLEYRYIAENIYAIKQKCNKKEIPVFDDMLLSLTKPFNDKIFEKYGLDYLLEGIHNLIKFECTPSYVLKKECLVKKQWFNTKNRLKIQQLLSK